MTLADRALSFCEHLRVDEESDRLLEALVTALVSPLERADEVAGSEEIRPWQALTDPGVAPLWALPHAAQYTGGRVPTRIAGESEEVYLARARDAVVYPRGMYRGGQQALELVVLPFLVGESPFLQITEQFDDDPWQILVAVRANELAPQLEGSVDEISDAVNDGSVLPAGMHATVLASDDTVWDQLATTWDDIPPGTTWDDL